MKKIINSLRDRPNYSIQQLLIEDAQILQTLYDRNLNFALLTYGMPFSHIFGLFDAEKNLIAAIVAVRNYPSECKLSLD